MGNSDLNNVLGVLSGQSSISVKVDLYNAALVALFLMLAIFLGITLANKFK